MAKEIVPFIPNWANPVVVNVEFSTEVFVSRGGYETRSSLRKIPRVSISATGIFRTRRNSKTALALQLSRGVKVPNLLKNYGAVFSGSDLSLGKAHDIKVGDTLAIYARKEILGYTEVLTVSGLDVVVSASSVGAKSVRVAKLVEGRLRDSVSFDNMISSTAEGNFVFDALGPVWDFEEDWLPAQSYRGRPVVLWPPNYSGGVREVYSAKADKRDLGYGAPSVVRYDDKITRSAAYEVTISKQEELDEVLRFFNFCRGKQASFYAPTWTEDFNVESFGDNYFVVSDDGQDDIFNVGESFRHVGIKYGDSVFITPVSSIVADANGLRVNVIDDIPVAFKNSSMVFWVMRQRFSDDSMDFEFLTDSVCSLTIGTESISDEIKVLKISNKEVTLEDGYITMGDFPTTSLLADRGELGFEVTVTGRR